MTKRHIAVIVVVLSLVSLYFLASTDPREQPLTFVDRAIVAVYRPIAAVVGSISQRIDDSFNHYLFLAETQKKNAALKNEIERLKFELQTLHLTHADAKQEADAGNTYRFLNGKLKRAQIIAFDPFAQSKTVLINIGTNHGVKSDAVVLSPDGLVGRIIQVFDGSSKVLLLIDDHFAVDVANLSTRARCLVSGLNTDLLSAQRYPFLSQVEYFQNESEMHPGDALVTSGVSNIYPAGIPVGRLEFVSSSAKGLFRTAAPSGTAIVVPAVDFAKLTHVYVLQ